MRLFFLLPGFLFLPSHLVASVLDVGPGYPYANLEEAAIEAVPGDTIRLHEGQYPGGLYIQNVQGTADAWIVIEAAPGEQVIFEGGSNAWQFTDAAYLEVSGIIFQHQTGNGLNFDDGGTYASPAHHVRFLNCTFRDMSASGNNDLLKLSGLDSFVVFQCTFLNGAEGGSGIDMVGCHDGIISGCYFENLGSNCIQAKGGTRNIRIEANFFKHGGQRTLNLGGSTGLPFFRPIDAPYEAADLQVFANVFIGSVAPVAFVGSINCSVINNTMYLPEKWVLRILQETVDTTRFPPCGHNIFRNNVLYRDERVNVDCNIGPNTDPESFTFSNNLWFHSDHPGEPAPNLPVPDIDQIVGLDPLFEDTENEIFALQPGSPAIGNGYNGPGPEVDFIGQPYAMPRSIGAFEGGPLTGQPDLSKDNFINFKVFPNPAKNELVVAIPATGDDEIKIKLFQIGGQINRAWIVHPGDVSNSPFKLELGDLPCGIYGLSIQGQHQQGIKLISLQ